VYQLCAPPSVLFQSLFSQCVADISCSSGQVTDRFRQEQVPRSGNEPLRASSSNLIAAPTFVRQAQMVGYGEEDASGAL